MTRYHFLVSLPFIYYIANMVEVLRPGRKGKGPASVMVAASTMLLELTLITASTLEEKE